MNADAPHAEIRFRVVTADEDGDVDENWAAILGLLQRAFAFMEGRIDPPSSLRDWSAGVVADAARKGFVIVGEATTGDAAPIACAFAEPVEDALYLGKIAVDETARRRGLLRDMIAIAAREARLGGFAALTLETRIELTENHAAFAALGFEKTGETRHPGYGRATSITMRKTLAPPHLRYAEATDAAQRAALAKIVRSDAPLMAALRAAREFASADGMANWTDDWWIVSGAVYNAVWNRLTGRAAGYGVKDIDLFYWDDDVSWDAENAVIQRASAAFPASPPIEIRNQARVPLWYRAHFGHDYPPISSCREAIELFACRTHCVGARLEADGDLTILAPYGLADIFGFRLTPNPRLPNRATHEAKAARQAALWPELTVEPWPEAS